MNSVTRKIYDDIRQGEYKKLRRQSTLICREDRRNIQCQVANFHNLLSEETPLFYDGDPFGFNRSINCRIPAVSGNVTVDYEGFIKNGLDVTAQEIKKSLVTCSDEHKKEFGYAMLSCLDDIFDLCERYRLASCENGLTGLSKALETVPHKGAKTLFEALVFMKICTFVLRIGATDHVTLGRFDKYMYPYYLHDRENGVSDERAFDLVEQFFLSLNRDSDLYNGVQQGDNGQSMVLGGFDGQGNSMYNELSEMCMDASLEICMIDPKINLRVGKNTPDELYEKGTLLTKAGLGFPQYCNDDVVVNGLVKLGYDYKDALDYTVAACWEYIIPGKGSDIPNYGVMDFPAVINKVIHENLCECDTFEALMEKVREGIKRACDDEIFRIGEMEKKGGQCENPVLGLFMDGTARSLSDPFKGGTKYLNFGCHGAGIANATDALAAVRKTVYDEKSVEKKELLAALNNDFEGFDDLREKLLSAPKMGNNDDLADSISLEIMRDFSDFMNGRDNGRGGVWRAGTGSAMEYLWKGEKCPATADGRKKAQPYSSSFSPSLDVRTDGLLSVIQSFTKYDLSDIINGGPLTIEIHDTVLRNDIGIKKTAQLVKEFVNLGGHQLQLNSINRETLLDAQKHPEDHKNLIVRVWGWSGYFNELDVKYQNHVIRRLEYNS